LFLAWVDDIQEQTGCSRENANQLAIEGFRVIVSRRDANRSASDFEEHTSVLGYRTIAYMICPSDQVTGGKIEGIACSLWLLGTRIAVLHDIPFTLETAKRVLSVIKEWECSDRRWCLLLGRPKRKFPMGKAGFHFGIANTTYLKRGMLDTKMDVLDKGSQYNLDEVFRILIRSAKKHGWWEQYFDFN
jgi:hypothetical protein